MIRRTPLSALLLLLATLTAAQAASPARVKTGSTVTPARTARVEVAVFAMGCFWCGETQFEQQPGVLSVISGFAGGREEHPSYEQVSAGETGHYESVQVTFDPAKTSYARLLDLFWHAIDPTQGDGQFCDRGRQYRSVVFVSDERQRKLAEDSKRALESSGVLHAPIVTQILPATRFWPAEDYHQDFWKKDPVRYRSYRLGCGRDRRLAELWGGQAAKPLVH
jgi:peptide-methionine (S)-S-oxide reductase